MGYVGQQRAQTYQGGHPDALEIIEQLVGERAPSQVGFDAGDQYDVTAYRAGCAVPERRRTPGDLANAIAVETNMGAIRAVIA